MKAFYSFLPVNRRVGGEQPLITLGRFLEAGEELLEEAVSGVE